MKTGLCMGCQERLILVHINRVKGKPNSGYHIVRKHRPCGSDMDALDIEDVPALALTRIHNG